MFELQESSAEDFGPCECCGSFSRTVGGRIEKDSFPYVAYRVQWTLGQVAKHGAAFYLLFSRNERGTPLEPKLAVKILYRNDAEASGFMVVDHEQDEWAGFKYLKREEVVGAPLAPKVFELLDLIWLNDGRIKELTDLQR